ncbi:MAG: RbsD/FucU domain-containing protein [Rhodobacter sp.]
MSCARWAMVIRWLLTDTNFPAEGLARKSSFGRLLRIDNVPAAAAAQAVLSLMPFVTFFDDFAMRMLVVGAPHEFPPVQKEVREQINLAEAAERPMVGLERFAFYEQAKQAYAII